MKVRALFLDYDGTIAPLGVPRDESRVFRNVKRELRWIAPEIPVCVVTAKDFDFIWTRCRFASGWACASGLDIRLADGRTSQTRPLRSLDRALEVARSSERTGSFTELKRGPSKELLGVTIDWSRAPEGGGAIVRRLRALEKQGDLVAYDGHSTFADVYAAPPDKGRAVRALKRLLSVKFGVMFIGDSVFDNSAFQEAEMALGIDHGQPTSELRCDYIVEQRSLAGFLRSLRDRGMEFTPSLPWVRTGGGR